MKKARDYAAEFQVAADKDRALIAILNEMHQETVVLLRQRAVACNEGLVAVLNETDDKFRSFARQVGKGVNPKAFALMTERLHPETYRLWVRKYPSRAHGIIQVQA